MSTNKVKPPNYLFASSDSCTGKKSCKVGPKDVARAKLLFMNVRKPSFPSD